jgi:CheY-like chemotaxis protein
MQKTVLLVEDYEDSRLLMRHMIEQEGHSVIEAAGAYEAIEKAEQYHPDLVLMDIGLPLLDGLSTATIIKACSTKAAAKPARTGCRRSHFPARTPALGGLATIGSWRR